MLQREVRQALNVNMHFLKYWLFSVIYMYATMDVVAVDSVGVGAGIEGKLDWFRGRASSKLVSFSADSVWMWNVSANSNLGPGIPERNGFLLFPTSGGNTFIDGAEVMYDGDPLTAFDPDDFAEVTGLTRTSTLYIDLGTTFRVNRIRFAPRLDEVHKNSFLRAFRLSTNDGLEEGNLFERKFEDISNIYPSRPNLQPVFEERFPTRDVRYIRLIPRSLVAWEIAELEVFSDGSLPAGEVVSVPLLVNKNRRPLWGRVRYEGGDISDLPVTVQTRSGNDPRPEFFYRLTGIGSDRERISEAQYSRLDVEEKGPILPNPAWSFWETATDGLVRSPGVDNKYIQFRILFSKPGTAIQHLLIEFTDPPIAASLEAEIDPLVVNAGEDTTFTISMLATMRVGGERRFSQQGLDSGFQRLRILSDATIHRVEHVFVDDRPVEFSQRLEANSGAFIRLNNRLLQDGTFIQIVLRATVFRDATSFEIQAEDRRVVTGRLITIEQRAGEADIDPVSFGGSLVVRLDKSQGQIPLLDAVVPTTRILTLNGDGINEQFGVDFNLLKVTQAIKVTLAFFDLNGVLVQEETAAILTSGAHRLVWNGLDNQQNKVLPGLYIYQLKVENDLKPVYFRGLVGVVY